MSKRLTFSDHIRLSVPHDDLTKIGHVLILRRGDEVMTCEVPKDGDTRVSVARPGEPWRVSMVNETDSITRMWTDTDVEPARSCTRPFSSSADCAKGAGHAGACGPR